MTDKRRFVRKHNGRRREEASLVRLGWVWGGVQFKIRGKKAAMSEEAANRFFFIPLQMGEWRAASSCCLLPATEAKTTSSVHKVGRILSAGGSATAD